MVPEIQATQLGHAPCSLCFRLITREPLMRSQRAYHHSTRRAKLLLAIWFTLRLKQSLNCLGQKTRF